MALLNAKRDNDSEISAQRNTIIKWDVTLSECSWRNIEDAEVPGVSMTGNRTEEAGGEIKIFKERFFRYG